MKVTPDQITKLCTRLVSAQDPAELHPVATQLQRAIHERVDRVRENAVELAIVDRIIDSQTSAVDETGKKNGS